MFEASSVDRVPPTLQGVGPHFFSAHPPDQGGGGTRLWRACTSASLDAAAWDREAAWPVRAVTPWDEATEGRTKAE